MDIAMVMVMVMAIVMTMAMEGALQQSGATMQLVLYISSSEALVVLSLKPSCFIYRISDS